MEYVSKYRHLKLFCIFYDSRFNKTMRFDRNSKVLELKGKDKLENVRKDGPVSFDSQNRLSWSDLWCKKRKPCMAAQIQLSKQLNVFR
jgi:hypothetical protein